MSAVGGYSGNAVKPISLRFIAEMGQNPALAGMHISGMGEDRRPILDGKKCVGCHLCLLVCPQHAITSSRQRITKK